MLRWNLRTSCGDFLEEGGRQRRERGKASAIHVSPPPAGIEQKDRSVAASIQFQVGDKCLVPVPGQPGAARYKGEIASPLKPNACHMVCCVILC